jgi:putative hemolysin
MLRGVATHKITFAQSGETRAGQLVVRALENATGRLGLIRRAVRIRDTDFWEDVARVYGLSLEVVSGQLSDIPKTGPLILVANHPYGILDGLMMGLILARTRCDFRLLANDVFQNSEVLRRVVLPIAFEANKSAQAVNIQTRKAAHNYLEQDGAIGVFPGGTVSTASHAFGQPFDPEWGAFTARLIAKSNATVVPIYFAGHTSRMFQIASHLHTTLRLGLFINEFRKRVDRPVRVAIGKPINPSELLHREKDAREMMDFLRRSTYELSPKPMDTSQYGYDFARRR